MNAKGRKKFGCKPEREYKSEFRRPKSEASPKSEFRRAGVARVPASGFGLRIAFGSRISVFGFSPVTFLFPGPLSKPCSCPPASRWPFDNAGPDSGRWLVQRHLDASAVARPPL